MPVVDQAGNHHDTKGLFTEKPDTEAAGGLDALAVRVDDNRCPTCGGGGYTMHGMGGELTSQQCSTCGGVGVTVWSPSLPDGYQFVQHPSGTVETLDANGQRNSTEFPSVITSDGSKFWYVKDQLHRDGGPAIEREDGTREYWDHGRPHRLDGPAVEREEWDERGDEYWLYGQRLMQQDWETLSAHMGSITAPETVPFDTKTPLRRAMASGHLKRTGHQLQGNYVTVDGLSRLERTCCPDPSGD